MAVFRRHQFSVEKGTCKTPENTTTELSDPSGFGSDPFTHVLRVGARKLIEQSIHAELGALKDEFSWTSSRAAGHASCAMGIYPNAR